MIRVLHIISTNAFAGTERYLLDLLKNSGKDIEFTVVYPGYGQLQEALESINCKVVELAFTPKCFPATAYKLWKLIRNWRPDVVHTHLGKATLLGALLSQLASVKVVVTTLHFIHPAYASTHNKLFYPIFLWGHKLVNTCLTGMIAISQAVATETVQREKVNPAKIVKISHGTAFQAQFLNTEERIQAKLLLGLKSDGPVVVTVARLEKEKGHDIFLKAVPHIVRNHQKVQFLWVGEGNLRQQLEQDIKQLKIVNQIHLLGFQKNIAVLLAIADIFVLPAPEEPFGLAILEAMTAGLPVVAIDAGGPAEIIIDGETGLLVPPEPVSLAGAVCDLLAYPEKAKQMGEAGKQRSATEYTVERMVKQTEQLYFNLLNSKKKTSKHK